MAVPLKSRYFRLPVYAATDSGGVVHPTVSIRRHVPPPADASYFEHLLTGVETMEYLAWRFYGSSEDWWRIADVGPLVFPLDLQTGFRVAVPSPREIGRVQRTRSF